MRVRPPCPLKLGQRARLELAGGHPDEVLLPRGLLPGPAAATSRGSPIRRFFTHSLRIPDSGIPTTQAVGPDQPNLYGRQPAEFDHTAVQIGAGTRALHSGEWGDVS